MTTRLIERYLPIAELSEESVRERRVSTSLPPINFLHVWWARRPLIASRAAILASVLPSTTSSEDFKKAIGIHGDPVAVRKSIDLAKRLGRDLGSDPYGYTRAYQFNPMNEVNSLLGREGRQLVADFTAGGGSIPFEAVRMGFRTLANDLNPVAALILRASVEYPAKFGDTVLKEYEALSTRFMASVTPKLEPLYPAEAVGRRVDGYLWARTITCPYCAGTVPLAPNWKLSSSGAGIAIDEHLSDGPGAAGRHCTFRIVQTEKEHSEGTVSGGDANCPYSDCLRPIDGDEIKRQAGSGDMGDVLFAIVLKEQIQRVGKDGRARKTMQRAFRAAEDGDNIHAKLGQIMDKKIPEWDALDLIPSESYPEVSNDLRPIAYGMPLWRDMYSPRQLLAHGFASETYRELLAEDENDEKLDDVQRAAYVYLAFALDKFLNWNARLSSWNVKADGLRSVFDRHDFAFKWSFGEMAAAVTGGGLAWSIGGVRAALKDIIRLLPSMQPDLINGVELPEIQVANFSAAAVEVLDDKSVDVVVIDPPYGANVMYAELSDFFYVWLKRTAGRVVPDLFTRRLTDKDNEAVANKAHFQGQKGAAKLANRDYQDKMAGIFAECRRVLKDDGIMTVMFTHKDTGAWDALAMSLMHAGFVITASWPVNTEASGSLHIKDKAAANSTIFLVCRPRLEEGDVTNYWEDVEPLVAKAVRDRIDEFQTSGIAGVDLYLASFGPALEAFSRHWPLTRGTPAPQPSAKRGSQGDLLEEFDPYAVRPEDALNAARREVKAWRLAQLADRRASRDMDPATAWVALAWDAFRAPQFAYDEGLRLARAVGLDMTQVVGRIAEKKGSDLKLWDSATRVAKGALGPANGSRGMIDALHHAAHTARKQSVEAARDLLEANGLLENDEFKVALEVMLEVLPPSKTFSGIDAEDAVKPAADDFDALEKLRRIVYGDEIGAPKQLSLYEQLDAA